MKTVQSERWIMHRPEGSLISHFSNMVKNQGGINLAQGVPGFDPPKPLLDILLSYIHKDGRIHQYAPGNGVFDLLELLAEHYSPLCSLSPENILVTQGATEGLSLLLLYLKSILGKKQTVMSFDPPYESYPVLPKIYNMNYIGFPWSAGEIDFTAVERTIQSNHVDVVIIASPGNPHGRIWSEFEWTKLRELSHQHDFYVIYDAVYKDIYFKNHPFSPLIFDDARFFYVDSFSKMLSITGWRLGYIITESAHMKAIRRIHDFTGLSGPSLFQLAVVDYLRDYDFGEEYVRQIRSQCTESLDILQTILDRLGFRLPTIEGGYFLWAGLPDGWSDGFEFASQLYDRAQVAVVPGENFAPRQKDYVRILFAADPDIIREAGEHIMQFIKYANDRGKYD